MIIFVEAENQISGAEIIGEHAKPEPGLFFVGVVGGGLVVDVEEGRIARRGVHKQRQEKLE